MKIAIWIAQVLLATVFGMAGSIKLTRSYEDLLVLMTWTEDFSIVLIRIIAILELLAVVGLLIPMMLQKFQKIVPLAAMGLG